MATTPVILSATLPACSGSTSSHVLRAAPWQLSITVPQVNTVRVRGVQTRPRRNSCVLRAQATDTAATVDDHDDVNDDHSASTTTVSTPDVELDYNVHEAAPDPSKRQLLTSSLLLLASISAPVGAGHFWGSDLLVQAARADSDEQYPAQDSDNGKDIIAAQWVKTHPVGDRTIAKGFPDGPVYLVIEKQGVLANYGINAICTHMGCVVPWVPEEDKFMCPCHGSQYDNRGQVVQGPAPLNLPLVHVNTVNDKVVFSPWLETDFRDGEAPWWAED